MRGAGRAWLGVWECWGARRRVGKVPEGRSFRGAEGTVVHSLVRKGKGRTHQSKMVTPGVIRCDSAAPTRRGRYIKIAAKFFLGICFVSWTPQPGQGTLLSLAGTPAKPSPRPITPHRPHRTHPLLSASPTQISSARPPGPASSSRAAAGRGAACCGHLARQESMRMCQLVPCGLCRRLGPLCHQRRLV